MSGAVRTIFGGGTQQTSSTPSDQTPSQYAGLRPEVANLLNSLFGGGNVTAGLNSATGGAARPAATAGVTGNEHALLGQLMRPTGDQQYLTDSIAGRYTNPQSNPFLNSYIQAAQRPTFDALDQTLSRTLPGRFAAAGQYTQPQSSSAFDRAAGLEATNAAHTAGDIASNIGAQAYNTDRNLQQQAVPLNQQEVQTTINNLNAQALPRLIQQYGIDQGLQMHNQNIQNLMGILQLFQGFTSPTVAQTARGSQETNSGVLAPIRIH